MCEASMMMRRKRKVDNASTRLEQEEIVPMGDYLSYLRREGQLVWMVYQHLCLSYDSIKIEVRDDIDQDCTSFS